MPDDKCRMCREAKRQKLEELSQQLHMLENDIQLVKQRSDAVRLRSPVCKLALMLVACGILVAKKVSGIVVRWWMLQQNGLEGLPEAQQHDRSVLCSNLNLFWQAPEGSNELDGELPLPHPAALLQNRLRQLSAQPGFAPSTPGGPCSGCPAVKPLYKLLCCLVWTPVLVKV